MATGVGEAETELPEGALARGTRMSDDYSPVKGEWVVKQLDQADGYLSTIGTWGSLGSARWFDTEQDAQAAAVTECPDGSIGAALHINMAGPPSR